MIDVLLHIATVLGLLFLVGVNCFALGWPMLAGIGQEDLPHRAGRWFLALTTGLGCYICILVALGLIGQLNLVSITAVFAGTLAAHLIALRHSLSPLAGKGSPATRLREAGGWIVRRGRLFGGVAAVAVPLLIYAIAFQRGWDAYAYHLPQASLIAESGRLAIDRFIVQPLHPHYYHMLYAAGLIVGKEALPDAIHAASGLLVVFGLFLVGRKLVGTTTALFASVLFLLFILTFDDDPVFATAYVDLGTALFTTAACYCLACAFSHAGQGPRLLCMASFLLGISIGVKMQAMVGLPAFVLIAAFHPAEIRVKARAAAILAAVGGFWYFRNYLVSGDPIHPLGGSVFGYWAWNAADLEHLKNVIEGKKGLPPLAAFLALAAPALFRDGPSILKPMWVVSCIGGILWGVSSLNSRYLVSIYPVIALTAACVLQGALKIAAQRLLPAHLRAHAHVAWRRAAQSGCVILTLGIGALRMMIDIPRICATDQCRDELLGNQIWSYAVMRDVRDKDWLKVYQIGLEHELWFMTAATIGADYGPARNSDLLRLGTNGHAVKAHLDSLGRNGLLFHQTKAVPFLASESFLQHFELYKEDQYVVLYVSREALSEQSE